MYFLSLYWICVTATPECIDADAMLVPSHAKSWMWLIDTERACALLIGRCLGGMLIGAPQSTEEGASSPWLSTHLLNSGLEMPIQDLGWCL